MKLEIFLPVVACHTSSAIRYSELDGFGSTIPVGTSDLVTGRSSTCRSLVPWPEFEFDVLRDAPDLGYTTLEVAGDGNLQASYEFLRAHGAE